MIPATAPARQSSGWQNELACAISDPAELLQMLDLDPALLPAARQAAARFPLRVPRGYVGRMRKGDPNDPLLRQVLPLGEEIAPTPGFNDDPVGDLDAMATPGVLHKYAGRVLLVATGACGIHCRYCFRREYPYAQAHAGAADWQQALDYLAGNPDISEVILSGGDPLSLSNRRLETLLTRLASLPHLKRLRIHSRQPIVLPQRVDSGLLGLLGDSPLKQILVVQANHPREIDLSVRQALKRLASVEITLFNQSVLLKGVNDSAAILTELSETLFDAGVIPYYLHLLDRVRGTAHFEVDETSALTIMEDLRNRLPGYLVPRLVREEAGRPAKTPVP
jgi:EF-P beta-lysylation protein EpmB